MNTIHDFIDIIHDIISFFEELTLVEQNKLEAIHTNNIARMEEYMKKEQAFILKLRGMDKKREQIQKELGYENFTYREIIDHSPDDIKDTLNQLYQKLEQKLTVYKSVSNHANSAIELNIHKIDTVIEKLKEKKSSQKNGAFPNKGTERPIEKKPFTSKKI